MFSRWRNYSDKGWLERIDFHPLVPLGTWDGLWSIRFFPLKTRRKHLFFWEHLHLGVAKNRGTPKWMVYNGKWKTLLKWMIWGYHYFRKHPSIYPLQREIFSSLEQEFSSCVVSCQNSGHRFCRRRWYEPGRVLGGWQVWPWDSNHH